MVDQVSEQTIRNGPAVSAKPHAKQIPWLFLALTFSSVLPFWTVRFPVMADYPNHLARWFVLAHANDPHFHFSHFYLPAWGLLPYISLDVLATILQCIFPIDVVGRCILSLCVISVALASFFFIKKACPENLELAMFAIVVAFNPNFLMGSLNDEASITFCLLVLGLWIVCCSSPRVGSCVGVALLLVCVYLSHLIGFLVAGVVMGVYALFQTERLKKLGLLAILSLPAMALFFNNFLHSNASSSFNYKGLTLWDKFRALPFPVRLFTSKTLDALFLAGLVLFIIVLFRATRLRAQPVWIAVCGAVFLLYFVAPGEYGLGGYADVRILPFLYLLSLAAFQFRKIPWYLVAGLALLVVCRVATVEQMFIGQQRELQQLSLSFAAIPRNARVMQLQHQDQHDVIMGRGDLHHLDYGVIQRGFLVPSLFHLPGVQPIRLVADVYCPNIFCYVWNPNDNTDWQKIANSYDYLWLVKNPALAPFASRIGDVVLSNDAVTVYRIRHSGAK
jgi:hypothetical protein